MKAVGSVVFALLCSMPIVASAAQLSLGDALEEAERSNEDIEILNERVTQSRAARREAMSALLPQLVAGATTSYNGEEVQLGDRVVRREIDWALSGTASLTLFDGSAYPLVSQASRALEATELDTEWQRRVLLFDVESTYFQLAAAQRDVEIATATVALRQAYVDRATALEASGVALPLDVARATVQLLDAQQAVLEAETNLSITANALAVLLGREPDGALRATATETAGAPPETAVQDDQRVDLLADAKRVEAARALRTSRWWSLAPTLDVGSNFRYGPSSFTAPTGVTWSISATLSWVLYDGGARYARIEAAESALRETELRQQQFKRQANAGLQDALRQWQTARKAIDVAQKQADVARQAYEMTVARFESGLATSIEVTEASDQLFRAESALSTARLSDDVAHARFRYLSEAQE